MLGVGIIIPVIPALFFEPHSTLFDPGTSYSFKSITYGLLLASYPFMQFFGAPYLGALSDRFGRKPMISISLAGTMLGYLLFAYSILSQNLILMFFSRMLPGFTGGNISIIMSAIADVSQKERKTRNFGMVGMAFGLGFILGPTLGGILADNSVVGWFNPSTPFWFTALLTLINIFLVQLKFQETLTAIREVPLSLFNGFRNIARSFSMPKLKGVFSVVLLLALGFTFFTQFYAVLLIEKFAFSEKDIGFLYGWIGVWLVITQGVTVRYLSRRIASEKVLIYSTLCLSIAIILILLPRSNAFWFYLIAPLIATAQGITSPNMTTVVSENADASSQGEILGIQQSMNSLGQMIPPVIAGYLNTLSISLPIICASGLIFLAWIIYSFVLKKK